MPKKPKPKSDAKPKPKTDVVVVFENEPEREWKVRMLIAGGFSKHQAFRLSLLPGLDYRRAVRMLERGADFTTIYDILS